MAYRRQKRSFSILPANQARNKHDNGADRSTIPAHSNSHNSPTAILGSFEGAEGLWKNEKELLDSIPSITARRSCESIVSLVKSLDKDLHIQHFNRKNGFSFIVKGLKIAEIKLGSGGFVLTLIRDQETIKISDADHDI